MGVSSSSTCTLVESELGSFLVSGLERSLSRGISLLRGPVCQPKGVYLTTVLWSISPEVSEFFEEGLGGKRACHSPNVSLLISRPNTLMLRCCATHLGEPLRHSRTVATL